MVETSIPGYALSDEARKKLDNHFSYHAPKGNQAEKYELIRAQAKELAELLSFLCPPSRELSVALTELETSVMWANASIARNETGE